MSSGKHDRKHDRKHKIGSCPYKLIQLYGLIIEIIQIEPPARSNPNANTNDL